MESFRSLYLKHNEFRSPEDREREYQLESIIISQTIMHPLIIDPRRVKLNKLQIISGLEIKVGAIGIYRKIGGIMSYIVTNICHVSDHNHSSPLLAITICPIVSIVSDNNISKYKPLSLLLRDENEQVYTVKKSRCWVANYLDQKIVVNERGEPLVGEESGIFIVTGTYVINDIKWRN